MKDRRLNGKARIKARKAANKAGEVFERKPIGMAVGAVWRSKDRRNVGVEYTITSISPQGIMLKGPVKTSQVKHATLVKRYEPLS